MFNHSLKFASSETFPKLILQLFQNNNYCSWNLAGKKLDNLEYQFNRFSGSMMFVRFCMNELGLLVSK